MVEIQQLQGPEQTGREMYRLVKEYSGDINQFDFNGMRLSDLPFGTYYDLVKSMPFDMDTQAAEIVTRPFLIWASPWAGWDCKKKAIVIASWLEENGIPYRFTAVSRRPDGEVHHVLVEALHNDEWIQIDATYPNNKLSDSELWTAKMPLPLSGAVSKYSRPLLLSISGAASQKLVPQFVHLVNNHIPGTMGEPVTIAAIITAIASIIASVIGAAASSKQQERTLKAIEKERARIEKLEQERAEQSQEQASETAEFLKEWGVPALLSAAAAAITVSNW